MHFSIFLNEIKPSINLRQILIFSFSFRNLESFNMVVTNLRGKENTHRSCRNSHLPFWPGPEDIQGEWHVAGWGHQDCTGSDSQWDKVMLVHFFTVYVGTDIQVRNVVFKTWIKEVANLIHTHTRRIITWPIYYRCGWPHPKIYLGFLAWNIWTTTKCGAQSKGKTKKISWISKSFWRVDSHQKMTESGRAISSFPRLQEGHLTSERFF